MSRNFYVFGRSQHLLANGRLCAVIHPQSPSGDGAYQYGRGSGLQPEPCSLNKRYPVEQSQRPEIHKPPGSSCKLEPAKATVGRPFRVAIPGACSDSYKAKALPYVYVREFQGCPRKDAKIANLTFGFFGVFRR